MDYQNKMRLNALSAWKSEVQNDIREATDPILKGNNELEALQIRLKFLQDDFSQHLREYFEHGLNERVKEKQSELNELKLRNEKSIEMQTELLKYIDAQIKLFTE